MVALDEEAYLEWKNWTKESFGQLTKGEIEYFDTELRSAGGTNQFRNVLEIGFGEGKFLAYCQSKGSNVTGVEISNALVDVARSAGFNVVHSEDMASLGQNQYDLIAAFDVVEHIGPDEIVNFFGDLAGRLAPNGKILIRFPNADSWLGNVNQNGDITHVMALGYLKLVYIAQETGLEIQQFRAEKRRGFGSGLVYGIHSLVSEPFRQLIGLFVRAIYFPKVPIVLTSSNVVAVLALKK